MKSYLLDSAVAAMTDIAFSLTNEIPFCRKLTEN